MGKKKIKMKGAAEEEKYRKRMKYRKEEKERQKGIKKKKNRR